jgi:hypothetical protein
VGGLNELSINETFIDNPDSSCCAGGFYFTSLDKLHNFHSYGSNVREIYLPLEDPNFKMINDPQLAPVKWRANMV